MTLVEWVKDWLSGLGATAGYRYSLGPWTEQPGRVIAVWNDGGREVVDEDYPLIRLVVVGDRGAPDDKLRVVATAEAIREAAKELTCLGPYVRCRPVGGIVGPVMTTEDRPFVELTLEFLK